tara:strand:- start:14 stop:265 length:252 start_codon:yes stop_codon:yes gene_type:complete
MESEDNKNDNSIDYLNNLKKKISELTKDEYFEIYKIIKKNNIKHTKNNNGIFLNLNHLTQQTINDIELLLKYYKDYKNINKID